MALSNRALPALSLLNQAIATGLQQAAALLATESPLSWQSYATQASTSSTTETADSRSSDGKTSTSSTNTNTTSKPAKGSTKTPDNKKQQSKTAAGSGPSTSQPSAPSTAPGLSLAALTAERQGSLLLTSRYRDYYRNILYRELMLKGAPRKWDAVPELESVTLSIRLQDTRLDARESVEKHELLLHMLALEHITGKPASFIPVPSRAIADKAAGVTVTLYGDTMYNFLEKLAYIVLPNQIGFEGVPQPRNVAEELLTAAARSRRPVPKKALAPEAKARWAVEFPVTNLLLFPDLEADFDLFEPLRSMQVRLEVGKASSAEEAVMLLEGLALPRAVQAAAAVAQ